MHQYTTIRYIVNGNQKSKMKNNTSKVDRSTLIRKYSTPILVSGLNGYNGQVEICSSSVLVVGAGGIGSTAILYLAASGIGRLGIADFDSVELSNLHRQVIHDNISIGLNKAVSATNKVLKLNSDIDVVPIQAKINIENSIDIISGFDIVVDSSDNFETRYILNEACVELGIPLASGSAGM